MPEIAFYRPEPFSALIFDCDGTLVDTSLRTCIVMLTRYTRMDYDKSAIATSYDAARALTPEGIRQWQDLFSTHVSGAAISLVVDLGCGTGRFSELLAAHFGAQVIGIDPSQKMLDRARQKLTNSGVVFQQASAEALPLANGCVDLVFMSQVYHHLVQPIDVARECWRVLREGGFICIRNTTREVDFVYRHFFPTMRPLIDSELPGRQDIARVFVSAGFAQAVHQIVTHVVARDWLSFVQKSALRGDSFLARLPTEEFNAGMAELRARAAISNPDDAVSEEIDWFVFIKVGSPTTRNQQSPANASGNRRPIAQAAG